MNILMVLMGLEIGGAETHVVELAIELARRGHTLHIASNGGIYEKELEAYNITHHKLPLNKKDFSSMSKSYMGLKKLIKENKFDIVHSHARIPSFLCGILHKKLKFRFITSAHWVFVTNFLLKHISNWGERSVAVSNDIKKYLIDSYNYPSENIDITINGIDTNKFSTDTDVSDIETEFDLSQSNHRIVYISRMDVDRSAVAFSLLEVAPRLYEKYSDLELVIVGGGNDYDRLTNEIEKLNNKIGKRIAVATNARSDINKFASLGNMFVGVSRSALEAMSAQKPVIIAGNEGYIGVFDEGKTEISIKTNFCCRGCSMTDNDVLFNDICYIFDSGKAEEMADFNRNFILENYSIERMTNDYEASYQKLLAKNPFRKNDVLISGYYGFKNTGDDSLLKAIITNLRNQNKNISITVLSKNPAETSRIYNVKSINRYNLVKLYFTLKHTRLLISGGGSLLQDVTSNKSYKYYSTVIKMAIWCKAKTMIYANGIGPLNSVRNRADCKKMLEKTDVITLRDENSLTELKNMAITKNAVVTADPAFSLTFDDTVNAPDKKFFIVSVRKWKHLPKDFENKVAEICRQISKRHNLIPIFIPMQNQLDKPLCTSIAHQCGGKVVEGFNDISTLLGYIRHSEFVIGMRLHSLIYSLSMGVPVIALSYDPKIDAIMDNWDCCKTYDARNFDNNKFVEQADCIMQNRQEISEKIKAVAEVMRKSSVNDAKTAVKIMTY